MSNAAVTAPAVGSIHTLNSNPGMVVTVTKVTTGPLAVTFVTTEHPLDPATQVGRSHCTWGWDFAARYTEA